MPKSKQLYDKIFCDVKLPLDPTKAQIEANRCYYCYDAPCVRACPTEIDIPSFIRKISNRNTRGAALDILSANIMGGTCARVCPVETLCQEACVRNDSDGIPVEIGLLQRFATDDFYNRNEQPFERAPSTGKKIAIIGAGPAGLSCAHKLATLGHSVTIFESKAKSGGLNEYGIAPYKLTENWAQREIDFILKIGGIEIRNNQTLGREVTLDQLRQQYSAVFLGLGLSGSNSLGVPGEDGIGVMDATRFIERIRQTRDISTLSVGKNVVVIGGGNTAIDIAIQMKRLGAENVTLVYRRGQEHMGATHHEQELAQTSGVLLKTWAKPNKITINKNVVSEIEFEYTEMSSVDSKSKTQKLSGTGRFFTIQADQIFKAIGQTLLTNGFQGAQKIPEISNGKIVINDSFETTIPGVFAGGDCVDRGEDLTVTSVQHGKLAALAIHKKLGGQKNG